MAKIVRYRAIPDPARPATDDVCPIAYARIVPAVAPEPWQLTRVVGWPMRSRAERATAPSIEPPGTGSGKLRGKLWTTREARLTAMLPSGPVSVQVRRRELDDCREAEVTEYRGLAVRLVKTPQRPVGEKLCADGLIRPTDQNGVVRY